MKKYISQNHQYFLFQGALDEALSRYQSSGFLDSLKNKWYDDLLCYTIASDRYRPQVC